MEGSTFCTECGAPVTGTQTQQAPATPASQYGAQPVEAAQQPRIQRRRQSEAKTSQPNPLQENVLNMVDKLSSDVYAKTSMIVAIIAQVLNIIYNGYVFHFSGALEDCTDFFVENIPLWVWTSVLEITELWVLVNVINVCSKIGMKSWLLYVTPLLWVATILLFDVAVLAELGYEDLKWIGRMFIITYIFIGILGFQMTSTRFNWLGKITMVTALLWIVSSLAQESLIPSILSILATVYWAFVANSDIQKYYDDLDNAYVYQNN